MNFKLLTLEFIPRGGAGWTSRKIDLTNMMTVFFGDNGTGKTPIVSGLAYGLGGTIEVPSEIKKHCSKVVVNFLSNNTHYSIERFLDEKDFQVYVFKQGDTNRKLLTDEKQFSDWMLDKLSIEQRTITGRSKNAPTPIYLSTLLPLLYIEQDHGWGTTYYAPTNRRFIKSQQEEMVRVILGLPARHQHASKKEEEALKRRIGSLDGNITRLKNNIDEEERKIAKDDLKKDELIQRKDALNRDLDTLQEGADRIQSISSSFDVDVSHKLAEIERLTLDKNKLLLEGKKYLRVIDGLEEESNMLSDNEKAAIIFRNLCDNNSNCGLFKESQDSYGRRLLFLQDQKKDIELQYDNVKFKIKTIDGKIEENTNGISSLEDEKKKAAESKKLSDVSVRIKERIKEITEIEKKLVIFENLETLKCQYNESFKKKKDLSDKLVEQRPKGARKQSEIETEVRDLFREKLEKWIGTLRTPNIDHRIPVKKDFSISIGDVMFTDDSEHSGSTRARIILSYHAAMLETSLEIGGNHPGFLIFDTPKQHELNEQDLDAYFKEFRKLLAKYPTQVQLILAVKDLPFKPLEGDFIWEPSFPTEEKDKFFGSEMDDEDLL